MENDSFDRYDREKLEADRRKEIEELIQEETEDLNLADEILEVSNIEMAGRLPSTQARIITVGRELLQGFNAGQIAQKYAPIWNINEDTIKRTYCVQARKAMREDAFDSLENMMTDIWLKYGHVYNRFAQEENTWGMKATLDAQLRMLAVVGMSKNEVGPVKLIEINIVDPNQPQQDDAEEQG